MVDYVKVDFNTQKLKESSVKTIKDKVLLAPGLWNGKLYSLDEIKKSYDNTDWKDKDVISLIADHKDDDTKGRPLTIRDWLGYISNPRLRDDGFLIGDLNICDSDLALKLENGAHFGISPYLGGIDDNGAMKDFHYKNFAVVVEPACKECFINLSDDKLNISTDNLTIEEMMNIKLGETSQSNMNGSKVESDGLQKVDYKKKSQSSKMEDNSIQLKGGENMTNEETIKNTSEEVKEEAPIEEVKEEVEEELSDDQLLEQIQKLTEKYLARKKCTPEESKMKAMEAEIVSLKDEIKKLSEAKLEVKEEKAVEKLAASPKAIAKTITNDRLFTFGGDKSLNGSSEFARMLGF